MLIILLKVGISGNMLAEKMQTALQNKLVNIAQTTIHDASLAFDENYHLTLEAHDVALSHIKGGVKIDKVGLLRVVLARAPLLQGNIKIEQLEIANSVIDIPTPNDESFFKKIPQTNSGHIDFDAVALTLFKSFDGLFLALNSQDTHLIVIRNVDVNFAEKGNQNTLHIDKLALQYKNNELVMSGDLILQNQMFKLDAMVNGSASHLADKFVFAVKNLPYHIANNDYASRILADGHPNNAYFFSQGLMNVVVKGNLTADNRPQLNFTLNVANAKTDIGQYNDIITKGEINLSYQGGNGQAGNGKGGNGQLKFLPSQIILGSLHVPLTGNIQPVLNSNEQGVYDFDVFVKDGHVKPDDIDLPRLDFISEITGRVMLKRLFVDFTHLAVQTHNFKLEGRGDLQFGPQSPQMRFNLVARDLPIDEAKQLWPLNLSSQARQWIVSNIAGGRMHNFNVKVNLPAGLFKQGKPFPVLSENEVHLEGDFDNVSSLLVGDLPALRNGLGRVIVKGTATQVFIDHASAYLDNEKDGIDISNGYLMIPWRPNMVVYADISTKFKGKMSDVVKFVSLDPIKAGDKIPFKANEISGNVSGLLKLRFPLNLHPDKKLIDWSSEISFDQILLAKPFDGNIHVTDAKGNASLNKQAIKMIADATLNDIPANVELVRPIEISDILPSETIKIQLTDEIRKKILPGLDGIISGTIPLEIGSSLDGNRLVKADVSNAVIQLPWLGWAKGKGIAGEVQFSFKASAGIDKAIALSNFSLKGDSFNIAGDMVLQNNTLQSANLSSVNLNRTDSLGMTIRKDNNNYSVVVNSKKFDARALIKMLSGQQNSAKTNQNFDIMADIDRLTGFYDETLKHVKFKMFRKSPSSEKVFFDALTADNKSLNAKVISKNNVRNIDVAAGNAGVLLRFMDLYDKVRGGVLQIALKSGVDGTLKGPVRINGFEIVNEPRLVSLVSSRPYNGGKSLGQAVKNKLNVSVAMIDTASAFINKGDSFLVLDDGIVRGQTIGATFQGIIYDARGNTSMTGTFMPAYGLNRVFSDIPIFGALLGNGRDRGLIGVTFKVDGKARDPKVTINPISVIAPGVFRQIFQYQQ